MEDKRIGLGSDQRSGPQITGLAESQRLVEELEDDAEQEQLHSKIQNYVFYLISTS